MMFKKITVFAVMAVLCLNFTVWGQEPIISIKVGDKLPESFWQQEYTIFQHGKTERYTLAQYKEKLLILDFWATWCTSCIQKFPFADSIMRSRPEKLMVLLVNSSNSGDTQEKIAARFSAYGPNLQTVIADTILRRYFPHKVLPHYIWIEQGQLRAATGGEFFTPENVASAIQRRERLDKAIEKRKSKKP